MRHHAIEPEPRQMSFPVTGDEFFGPDQRGRIVEGLGSLFQQPEDPCERVGGRRPRLCARSMDQVPVLRDGAIPQCRPAYSRRAHR